MRMMNTILTASVASAAVAVFASPAMGVETHKEYVAEVNPVCKHFSAAVKRIPKRVRPTGDPVVDFIRETAVFSKIFGKTIVRIRAVKPPASDRKAVKRWTGGLVRQNKLIRAFIVAAKRRDGVRATARGKKVAKVERRNARKARRIGLPACG